MLPDGLDLACVERFMHLQSDIGKSVEAYGPPPSDQHITLIRVEQEREQASRSAQDGREPELDSTYGWNAVRNRSPIIDIARSQATGEQISLIVDRQVQLKVVKPAHRRLALLGLGNKDAMLMDAFGIANGKRGRVNEADARTGSIATLQVRQ